MMIGVVNSQSLLGRCSFFSFMSLLPMHVSSCSINNSLQGHYVMPKKKKFAPGKDSRTSHCYLKGLHFLCVCVLETHLHTTPSLPDTAKCQLAQTDLDSLFQIKPCRVFFTDPFLNITSIKDFKKLLGATFSRNRTQMIYSINVPCGGWSPFLEIFYNFMCKYSLTETRFLSILEGKL